MTRVSEVRHDSILLCTEIIFVFENKFPLIVNLLTLARFFLTCATFRSVSDHALVVACGLTKKSAPPYVN